MNAPASDNISTHEDSPRLPVHKRIVRYSAGALGIVTLCALGYAGFRGYELSSNLFAVQDRVPEIKQEIKDKDFRALTDSIASASQRIEIAAGAANDPVLGVAAHLPFIGDDFKAIRALTNSASHLLASAEESVGLLPNLTGENLAASGSGFDLNLINQVINKVEELRRTAEASAQTLNEIDVRNVHDRIAQPVNSLSSVLAQTNKSLAEVSPYLAVLPKALAQDGQRTWFVTMQNLGEARSSGGLPGAWLVVRAENGKVEVLRQGSNDDLIKHEPVEYAHIMPQGYQDLWGDYLGSWLSMNLSANFPDNAALMLENWNSRGEEQVDGVIALGQGMLPYVAAAVGEVTVGEKKIAPADLDDYLTVGVYEDFQDVTEKDRAVDDIIAQVFSKISAGAFDIQAFGTTLIDQQTGDYVQMWSTDPALQSAIMEADLGGAFPNVMGPSSTVRIINAGENKLDIFLDVVATYKLGQCVASDDAFANTRPGELSVKLTNRAPKSGLPSYISGRGDLISVGVEAAPGSNKDLVAVYAPVDATVNEMLIDGEDASYVEGFVEGRFVYVFEVELLSGESKTLTLRWDEPSHDYEDRKLPHKPELTLQPLFRSPTVSTSTSGSCD